MGNPFVDYVNIKIVVGNDPKTFIRQNRSRSQKCPPKEFTVNVKCDHFSILMTILSSTKNGG